MGVELLVENSQKSFETPWGMGEKESVRCGDSLQSGFPTFKTHCISRLRTWPHVFFSSGLSSGPCMRPEVHVLSPLSSTPTFSGEDLCLFKKQI